MYVNDAMNINLIRKLSILNLFIIIIKDGTYKLVPGQNNLKIIKQFIGEYKILLTEIIIYDLTLIIKSESNK